jgi:hypothetical protein
MLNDRSLAPPAMPNIDSHGDSSLLPVTAVLQKVVLVEPDKIRPTDCASHLLEGLYSVTVVKDVRELFFLRNGDPFVHALLSDHLGSFALVAAAQSVRRQWPKARILVLGQASLTLEDHLYDDAIRHTCKKEDLFDALMKLSFDPWKQKAGGRPFIVQPLNPEEPIERGDNRICGSAKRITAMSS